jgi:CRP-like cAMP-binding protein
MCRPSPCRGHIFKARRPSAAVVARLAPHDTRYVAGIFLLLLHDLPFVFHFAPDLVPLVYSIFHQADFSARSSLDKSPTSSSHGSSLPAPKPKTPLALVDLGMLGPRQFFGELGVLTNRPRSASVYATSRVEVLMLSSGDFLARTLARRRGFFSSFSFQFWFGVCLCACSLGLLLLAFVVYGLLRSCLFDLDACFRFGLCLYF